MEFIVSVSPKNDHTVDIALARLEGKHGFEQDEEVAKKILLQSTNPDSYFYIG